MNPIRHFRNTHQMTRKTLSNLSGVPYSTLNNVESGYVSEMKWQTVHALSRVLEREPGIIQQEYVAWRESLQKA